MGHLLVLPLGLYTGPGAHRHPHLGAGNAALAVPMVWMCLRQPALSGSWICKASTAISGASHSRGFTPGTGSIHGPGQPPEGAGGMEGLQAAGCSLPASPSSSASLFQRLQLRLLCREMALGSAAFETAAL